MLLKRLLMAALAVLLLAVGWRSWQAGALRGLGASEPARPVQIKFDNGSVRDAAAPASATRAPRVADAPQGLRKCVRGTQVVYTDGSCPNGSKEQALRGGTVTVVPGGGVSPPAGNAAGSTTTAPRGTVRDVLDRSEEQTVQDRRLQQLVGK